MLQIIFSVLLDFLATYGLIKHASNCNPFMVTCMPFITIYFTSHVSPFVSTSLRSLYGFLCSIVIAQGCALLHLLFLFLIMSIVSKHAIVLGLTLV